MHKSFYTSGFIFHLPTQQILLQQRQLASSITSSWTLFEKEHSENKQSEDVFKNTISKLLNITLDNVEQIYSYVQEDKNYTLLYATVRTLEKFPPKKGYIFRWFSFKEVLKIKASEQTKHDIVVGQRVIEAVKRKEAGEHTF